MKNGEWTTVNDVLEWLNDKQWSRASKNGVVEVISSLRRKGLTEHEAVDIVTDIVSVASNEGGK